MGPCNQSGQVALTFTGGLGWGYNKAMAADVNHRLLVRVNTRLPRVVVLRTMAGSRELCQWNPSWVLGFGLGLQRSSYFSDARANVFVQRRWQD